MYAVKMWGKDCLPDHYAIISNKEYARYVTFFESEKPEAQFSMLGHIVRADEILQSLRMADKVNSNQATLIARYSGKQRDVFGELIPKYYSALLRLRKGLVHVPTDTGRQFKQYSLRRLFGAEFNEGDVLFNVFVLCHNPFDEYHDMEWILSYKSTVHVDQHGIRYLYINDTQSRDRAYEFAVSDDHEHFDFRCEPKAKNKPLLYKGADMGDD